MVNFYGKLLNSSCFGQWNLCVVIDGNWNKPHDCYNFDGIFMPVPPGNIVIRRNNFSKWIYFILTALSLVAILIAWREEGNGKWICLTGLILFGFATWTAFHSRIETDSIGFSISDSRVSREVKWKDIHSILFDLVYIGHHVQYNLLIKYADPEKSLIIPVNQYQKKPVTDFIRILDEQTPFAVKNEHFIKLAAAKMNWKDRLKMF